MLAVFTCTLSRPDMKVSWFREEEKLQASSKYEVIHEGRLHKLLVHDLCPEDYTDYLVVLGSRRLTGSSLREGWSILGLIIMI